MMSYRYSEPLSMPRGTHYGNNYWIMQSVKLGRRVTAFSNLEHYNHIRLEMDPSVIYYCEQPCRASVKTGDGPDRDVVFDVYVCHSDGHEEMEETKYKSELNGIDDKALRSQQQIAAERKWCSDNRISFRVVTEEDLLEPVIYMENLEFLYSHLKHPRHKPDDTKRVMEYLKSTSFRPMVKETADALGIPGTYCWSVLAGLYARGYIELPVSEQVLTGLSEIQYERT